MTELNAEIKSLEEALGKSETPEVRGRTVIYPNVKIRLKDLIYENQTKMTNTAFFEKDGQIEAKPYVI